MSLLFPQLVRASELSDKSYDATVLIFHDTKNLVKISELNAFHRALNMHFAADVSFGDHVAVVPCAEAAGGRLILAPTGPLLRDYDDVRRYAEVGAKAAKRAKQAGSIKPLFVFTGPPSCSFSNYEHAIEVALLGAYQALYESLEEREWKAKTAVKSKNFESIGFHVLGEHALNLSELKLLESIEHGRVLARDIIAGDPERMSNLKAAEHIIQAFKGLPHVTVSVMTDHAVLLKEYPLLHAVARASLQVPRHHPAVVKIEYKSPDQSAVSDNLFLVGKGISYDTGGADVKTGGAMRGMSRDKGGAAGVAGFLRTVAAVQPKHLNVTASLAFVRNSVGADSYVSDEVIVSRAGVRVLVGNTDAEGRMVMADLLAEHAEQILAIQKNSTVRCRCFTVATLTGHVIRAYGPYPACMDNGPARHIKTSQLISESGEKFGEPWERSTLRREDYQMVEPASGREDVVQCNTAPSTMTARGHQFPAAFMAVASGISKHGLDQEDSRSRIAYTHCDIAGAAEEGGSASGSLPRVTGAPVVSLSAAFLMH